MRMKNRDISVAEHRNDQLELGYRDVLSNVSARQPTRLTQ